MRSVKYSRGGKFETRLIVVFAVAPLFLLIAQPSYVQGWLTESAVAAVECTVVNDSMNVFTSTQYSDQVLFVQAFLPS